MRAFTRTLLLTSWFLGAISLQAQTSTDPSGHWDGTIHAPNLDVVIGIDLATNANGQFTGTFAQPADGVKGLPLSEIAVKGPSIRLLLKPGGSGGGTFNGTISADRKTISGDFIMADGGYAVPFSLTRTGEANIAPAPKSPPIAKELEGSWNGVLDAGGRQMRVLVTMANHPDGTAMGTIVSVDGTGVEIPIAIATAGSDVSLAVATVGATYSGRLNAAATEIAGTWTQGAVAQPLTLRRK